MTTLVNGAPPVRLILERRALRLAIGRPGPQGPPGPTGPAAEAVVMMFAAPATVWTINHNQGRKVDVALFTTGSVKMNAEVVLMSDDQAVAIFSTPTAGYARVI